MCAFRGLYTALVTPMQNDGSVDWEGVRRLLDFQIEAGVDGIVVGGTTGESATMSDVEFHRLLEVAIERAPGRVRMVAGTGRNSLWHTQDLTENAEDLGYRAVMLVDPYYNAPSSPEIRREFLVPLAQRFSGLEFLPYCIPGRTGTSLQPLDLALAVEQCPNISGVKDATGEAAYSREVRQRLPAPFAILCGDDARTWEMMRDPAIRADGLVSVVSNVVPHAMARFVHALQEGGEANPQALHAQLRPLLESVTIQVREHTPYGEVQVKTRNPVPIKATLRLLGLPSGRCRPPLGRLSPSGLECLVQNLQRLVDQSPDALSPTARYFGIDLAERLHPLSPVPGLVYDGY